MIKFTPLEEQYYEIKKQYPQTILFFQLGDFYEMWNEDAEIVAKNIGITLTKRNNNPMCGIPVGNLEFYLTKLVKEFGLQVAICEQVETPEEAKLNNHNIVTRAVVRIITPGSLISENPENNYILSCTFNEIWHLIYADLSTGECFSEEVENDFLLSAIYRIGPSEILLPKHLSYHLSKFYDDILKLVDDYEDPYLILKKYLESLKINVTLHPVQINKKFYMNLGTNTLRNLEIFSDLSGNAKNSLFTILNKTQTSMGKRLLKKMLSNPVCDIGTINERLECIEFFCDHIIKIDIGDISKQIHNIKSLETIYKIAENISKAINLIDNIKLPSLLYKMQSYNISCAEIIKNTLFYQNNELVVKNQELIKMNTQFNLITEQMEKLYTKSKVKHNSLIGYFIEVNKNITMPDEYILKQELSNTKRYTSLKIMAYEAQLNQLNEEMQVIRDNIFNNLKEIIENEASEINKISDLIGYIDYFVSCAKCAIEYNYTKPKFDKDLEIIGCRHAIIEHNKSSFITNNCILNDQNTIACITGPNMGGKSTYLRSVAMIILMSQCGMYVPAMSVKMKIFDGLFVRIGAGDNIFTGDSTFKVEMLECAEALKHGTYNSFIVFDEVGRGTSIKDGISISYAICDYLKQKKIFTLLSTHYLEMLPIDGIANYRVKILNENGQLSILYELEEGIAESSFGIIIAESVGLPKEILKMSRDNFDKLSISFAED